MQKIWFFGTGQFAAYCLQFLKKENVSITLVVTSPPTPSGRGLKLKPSLVEEKAAELNIPLIHSESVNKDQPLKDKLLQEKPDLIMVIDFGQKVLEPWLSTPKHGCLNIHPSLLPKYRGAAPVQRAIINGETQTGVTVFRLVEQMDAGPILGQKETPLNSEDSYGDLLFRLSYEGSKLMAEMVKLLDQHKVSVVLQNETIATLAPKIQKNETQLLPTSKNAAQLHDLIRALNPAPGAWFSFRGKRVKVWESRVEPPLGRQIPPGSLTDVQGTLHMSCAQNTTLALIAVQPEGKNKTSGTEWLKGLRLKGDEPIDSH